MSPLPRIGVLAVVDLRRLVRQRTTLFFTVALPVIIILVVGLATERFVADRVVGVVASDTPLAAELVGRLDAAPGVEVRRVDDPVQLRRLVRRGLVAAGVVVPEDLDARLARGEPVEVGFLAETARGLPATVRAAVDAAVASQAVVVGAARAAATAAGRPLDEVLPLARRTAATLARSAVRIERVGSDRAIVGVGFAYQAPANLVLFVFITSASAAAQLIETRRMGLTRRVLATPTPVSAVLVGTTAGRYVIALAQAAIIYLVGWLVFGVDWGDPAGGAALIAIFCLVAAGAGTLLGTLLRTPEQAGAVGPPLGIALGMLGGCMWPLEIVPPVMRTIGHLTPHAWAMDAWVELVAFGRGLAAIGTELAVLGGWALVLVALAVWRLRSLTL